MREVEHNEYIDGLRKKTMAHKWEFEADPNIEKTLPSLLEDQSEQYSQNTFLIHGDTDEHIKYNQMDQRANAFGNSIRELGLSKGEKVSILSSTPPRVLESIFGISKAGGVASPINYEYFGRELSYQLNDTDPEFLVIGTQYAERLNDVKGDIEDPPHLIELDTGESDNEFNDVYESTTYKDLLKNGKTTPPSVDVSWNDEALVLYTSGTTGNPKGCVLSHRVAVANQPYPMGDLLNENDAYHSPLPTYHVSGLGPVWTMLHSGGTAVLWDRYSTSDFWDRIHKYDVTVAFLLSVMTDWIYKQPEQPTDNENPIKYAVLQPLPDYYKDMAERFGFDILNAGFGQTETGLPTQGLVHAAKGENGTPESHLHGARPKEILERAEQWGIPIVDEIPGDNWCGLPGPGIEVTLLNENDEEVAVGGTGQIAIRPKLPSLILDRYYSKPKQTLEATSNLWFHTGDLGRKDEDGHYYFVDRMSNIMRRRGENISPQQIEEPLLNLEAVDQIAVFPVPAQEGGEDEVTVIVMTHEGQDVHADEVFEYLETELPQYMHPKYVEVWEEIPLTPTKKVQIEETKEQFKKKHPDFE